MSFIGDAGGIIGPFLGLSILFGLGLGSLKASLTNIIKAPQIKTFKEVYRYDAMSFIGDAGGIIGLFLGFSILSIYEELIKPLLHKISKQISSSK